MRLLLTFALFFILTTTTGCSGTIYPPRIRSDSVPVYVTNYGRHSSIIIPLAHWQGYVEWAYGDWLWFAENRTGGFDGIRALFFSKQATLGRRVLTTQPSDEAMRVAVGCKSILKLYVPSSRAIVLMRQLDARYARHGDTQILSSLSNLDHVKDPEPYWLFNNCNHEVAEWLRFLGAKVDGLNVESKYKLGPEQ